MYVPLLGKSLIGTVLSIVADNLGGHSIAGFIESFFLVISSAGFAQERSCVKTYNIFKFINTH